MSRSEEGVCNAGYERFMRSFLSYQRSRTAVTTKSSLSLPRNPKSGFEVIVFNRNPFVGCHAFVLRNPPPFLAILAGWLAFARRSKRRPNGRPPRPLSSCPPLRPSVRPSSSVVPFHLFRHRENERADRPTDRPTGQPVAGQHRAARARENPIYLRRRL